MSSQRILKILQFAALRRAPFTVTETSEHLQVPRATVYRLIAMLEREAVLQRTVDNKKFHLSNVFLRSMINGACDDQIVAGFRKTLVNLAATWGATAFLGRLNKAMVEIVQAITPPDKTGGYIHPGLNVRPAHACSSARAILAFLPEEQVDDVLGRDHSRFTARTITDKEALLEELRLTRERGYAICDEEIDVGVSSVAVPVIVGKAGVVCSLGIVAVSKRIHELDISAVGEMLMTNAQDAVLNLNMNMREVQI